MALRLSIVALGKLSKGLLEAAAAGPVGTFQLESFLDAPLADPHYAFHPGRGQHHAAAIVRKLGKSYLGAERDLILGVGAFDLFDPDGEHLIVDADREVRACLVGTQRLGGEGTAKLLHRLSHASIVAVGRALGLRDCDDGRCAMASVSSAEVLDKRTGKLCMVCVSNLEKGDRAWAKT